MTTLPTTNSNDELVVRLRTVTGTDVVIPRGLNLSDEQLCDYAHDALGLDSAACVEIVDVGLPDQPLRVVVRLRAGKGGFASNLRQQGRRFQRRAVNNDASRDRVTGRTLRSLRQEEALNRQSSTGTTGAGTNHTSDKTKREREEAEAQRKEEEERSKRATSESVRTAAGHVLKALKEGMMKVPTESLEKKIAVTTTSGPATASPNKGETTEEKVVVVDDCMMEMMGM
eukprot:PhM_4_TR7527/c0_g1_i1/m.55539